MDVALPAAMFQTDVQSEEPHTNSAATHNTALTPTALKIYPYANPKQKYVSFYPQMPKNTLKTHDFPINVTPVEQYSFSQ